MTLSFTSWRGTSNALIAAMPAKNGVPFEVEQRMHERNLQSSDW